MAAYWRSPYREPSNSFRSPDHSTLKFEQSLYLSRSRTSINSSKYDWLDSAFTTPPSNPNRHSNLTRSHTNIKSILKPPKRNGCVFPGKQTDSNSSGDSNNENGDSPKKDVAKKRVTFGVSKDMEDEQEQNESNYSHNKKCQLKAMKRISHSRLLEESAMKKLNRLIGGSTNIDQGTALPSVKGTGIPSPRHSADAKAPRSACSHTADLRCIRCIRKDVENNHDDRIHGKASINENLISSSNATLLSRDSVNDSEINGFNKRLETSVKDWSVHDQQVKDSDENMYGENFIHNREETSYRISNPSTASGSNNSKKHVRLLPGRYPFTTGAMQIKKLSIPDIQKAHRGDTNLTTEKTNVIALPHDKAEGKQSNDKNNEFLLRGIGTKTNTQNNDSPSLRIPSIIPPLITTPGFKNEIESAKMDRDNGYNDSDEDDDDNGKERKPLSDKTSDILHWLNDVHQKQTVKSRMQHVNDARS